MKSVKDTTQYTMVIKKSEFITTLVPCNDVTLVNDIIKKYAKDDATHNCVAYIIGPNEKADDDGEPSGTAGLPMLNVLKRQELTNIIAIVTRYFGGVKLGAGGLTRAYAGAVADALGEAEIVEKELVKKYQVAIDYTYTKKLDYLIKTQNIPCLDIVYDEKVHYTLFIRDEAFLDSLRDLTANSFYYKEIGEDYIEKI